ncbi:MAG: conserved hypothetical cytosolic protein [Fibrobacteres bacterium]|nr:conserved hypothetical cytosolic protein [Fibrobacterota bacterium]
MSVEYTVTIKRSALKSLENLPEAAQDRLVILEEVLRMAGPTGPSKWKNYSPLKGKKNQKLYHCHLSEGHQYVACWEYFKKSIVIEIYYIGPHPSGKYPTNRP